MQVATALLDGSVEAVVDRGATALTQQLNGSPQLAFAFASTEQPLAPLLAGLSRALPGAIVLGASTAGELTEIGDAKKHVALFAVKGDLQVFAGYAGNLAKDPEAAVRAAASKLPKSVPGYPHRTAILLLDALAGVSEETTLLAAEVLGTDVRLAGGAAGDDLHMKAPMVGLAGDAGSVGSDSLALCVLFTKAPLGVGVCHGHRTLSRPLTITKSKGATVFEVDGKPAWEAWKQETAAAAQKRGVDLATLSGDALGAYLLQFEAGLETQGSLKIRAPLSRGSDGSLSFACGIPEGSVVRITESEPEPQIASAREAAKRARAQLGGGKVAGALVFDCICRNLILGDRFGEAVRAVKDELGGAKLAGFESYGEVALDAGEMSGFHNTTTVVLAFPE